MSSPPRRTFVGRERELRALADALLPVPDAARPAAVCVIQGAHGVGKSALVERFTAEHTSAFPGRMVQVSVPGDDRPGDRELVTELANLLRLKPEGADLCAVIREWLLLTKTLLHLDDVDGRYAMMEVASLVERLDGCSIAVSGSYPRRELQPEWTSVVLGGLPPSAAADLLAAERDDLRNETEREALRALSEAISHLPLLLRLAAGHLRAGRTPAWVTEQLRSQGAPAERIQPASAVPVGDLPVKEHLDALLPLSLKQLREELGPAADQGEAALAALAWAPASGVGRSLAAAIAGLDERELEDLARHAAVLGLVEPRLGGVLPGTDGVRLHPLIAKRLRSDVDAALIRRRMGTWFLARLPALPAAQIDQQRSRWAEVDAETAVLLDWLASLDETEANTVRAISESYAGVRGPYEAWISLYEHALQTTNDDDARANNLSTLVSLANDAGDQSRMKKWAPELAQIEEQRGNKHAAGFAYELLAELEDKRGNLTEALRIRADKVLPLIDGAVNKAVVAGKLARALGELGHHERALNLLRGPILKLFEQEDAPREQAIARLEIARILRRLGNVTEALRIRREEVLPVLDRLGDIRSRAAVLADIGDDLLFQGEREQALKIYDELLEEAKHLGDFRLRASVLDRIAKVRHEDGELDEALRIYQEEVLPIQARLPDPKDKALTLMRMADILREQGKLEDALKTYLEDGLPVFRRQGDSQHVGSVTVSIAKVYEARGEMDIALHWYRDAVDIHARSGDKYSRAVATYHVATILRWLGRYDEALRLLTDDSMKTAMDAAGDPHVEIWRPREIASLEAVRGDANGAEQRYQEALGAAERLRVAHAQAVIHTDIGELRVAEGRSDEALKLYSDHALPVIERFGKEPEHLFLRQRIADALALRGDLDEAERLYRDVVVPGLEELGNLSALAGVVGNLSRLLRARGAMGEALLACADHLQERMQKSTDPRSRLLAQSALLETYLANGDLASSSELLDEMRRAAEALQDPRVHAAVWVRAAELRLACGDLQAVLEARRSQCAEIVRTGDERAAAAARTRLAGAHLARLEFDEAAELLERQVLPALGGRLDVRERAIALACLADVRFARGALDDALRIAQGEHLPLVERLGDVQSLILARRRIARILMRRGNPGDHERAAELLDLALVDADRLRLEIAAPLRRMRRGLSLERIEIQGFKNISHLEISLMGAGRGMLPGRWTCIAGINGSGKSAILQAIALVLLGPRAVDLRTGLLDRLRRRTNGHAEDAVLRANVRVGAEVRRLEIALRGQGIDIAELVASPEYESMKEVWEERERSQLVLAYGPGRNLSERLKGDDGDLHIDVRRQITLFDPLADVASAELLLERREAPRPFLGMLKRLLALVLKDAPIAVAPARDALRFSMAGATVPASELPDGFRAAVVWLADLCAAWCEKAPDEARDGDPSRIRAIVLIDEIDLYLHASLQRVLVRHLRLALPDVQWIVTTHSPLVLASFDRHELILLDAQQEGGIRKLDRQILGWSMDEVYEHLMGTEPISAALGEQRRQEDLALVLAQSPKVSEQQALENRELRRKLIERMKRRGGGGEEP